MKRRATLLSIGTMFLIGATTPPTETDIGSRIRHPKRAQIPSTGHTKEEKGRIALHQFARCTFAKSPTKTLAALELLPGKDGRQLAALASDDCLSDGSMKFSSNLFRGALYGELYRQHEADRSRRWSYPITPLDFSTRPGPGASSSVEANFVMLGITDCLYAADPESVREIVLNEPTSHQQDAAFAKLIPQLGSCIPAGVKLVLTRTFIESAFGEYLYRSLVPKIPVSAGKLN